MASKPCGYRSGPRKPKFGCPASPRTLQATRRSAQFSVGLWLLVAISTQVAFAQERVVLPAGQGNPFGGQGLRIQMSPQGAIQVPNVQPVQQPDAAQPKPGGPAQVPGQQPEKAPTEKGKEAASKDADVITRPEKPPVPPDPREFERAEVDPEGMVQLQFHGQSWPDILQWLAHISSMSLDWQELPRGYVNLRTHRPYSVEEIQDLINRHLLARGYTILFHGEFMTVVKCENLDASLVPRITPDQLAERMPHEFVRTTFPLQWMVAERAAEELKSMTSKNGKLSALAGTNQLDAVDTVANLRQLARVLDVGQPQSSGGQQIREFPLRFARAAEVGEQLEKFMGLQGSTNNRSAGRMTPQQMQMAQQQAMMQMQMAQQQRQGNRAAVRRTAPAEVKVVVNERMNSVLALAPPDKMAIIAEAIRMLDVPSGGTDSLQSLLSRTQVYRLAQLDPNMLVEALQEMGNLDPRTQLHADEQNRALIVHGPLADQMVIKATLERLDGSSRSLHVIPLRNLRADEVAGTIEYLMGQPRESNRRQSMVFGMFGFPMGRSNRNNDSDQFKVDADLTQNRLILRANDLELEEVKKLLEKLGELPARNADGTYSRVLESPFEESELRGFLERLRSGASPLREPASQSEADPSDLESRNPLPSDTSIRAQSPGGGIQSSTPADGGSQSHEWTHWVAAAAQQPRSDPVRASDDGSTQDSVDPTEWLRRMGVSIEKDPLGRTVIRARDIESLNLLERMIQELQPANPGYKVFTLKNAPAGWVRLNLEDFFEEEEEESPSDRLARIFSGMPSSSGDEARRLSKRKPIKFISDIDTNTILVQNADPEQLKVIAELIELYDVPEPVSTQSKRFTRLIRIQHSKANVVAATVKDAFKDLLSSNDSAFQNNQRNQQNEQSRSQTTAGQTFIAGFGIGASDNEQKPEERTGAKFKGKLSIGVDELSNSLLVSAEGEPLLELVSQMIESLDQAAIPMGDMQVVTLRPGMAPDALYQALSRFLDAKESKPTGGQNPTAGPRQQPPANGTPARPPQTPSIQPAAGQ